MGIYNSINEAFERKYGLADVKPLKRINEAKDAKKKGTSIMKVLLDNKKSIWSAMGESWKTARDLVLEILDRDELKDNPKVAEAKEVFKNVKSESKFASLVTTYMTGMSITKNEDLNITDSNKKEVKRLRKNGLDAGNVNKRKSMKESRNLNEKKKRDLWDIIYGELTSDGEQIINPKTGKPTMNAGAGYDNLKQITTDKAGNIVVRGKEERDFKAAIDIADKYAKQGVKYNIAKGDYGKGYTYGMTIEIPYEDRVDEDININVNNPQDGNGDIVHRRKSDNKEKVTEATDSHKDALGDAMSKYQQWVDYDMKRYHKISDVTKRALEKAGLEVIKDTYGDYEVIAKDKKALGESKDLDIDMDDIEVWGLIQNYTYGDSRLSNKILKKAKEMGLKTFNAVSKLAAQMSFYPHAFTADEWPSTKDRFNESKKLRERYYYINNNLSEKKAFWQSMRDAGASEKQLMAAQKGDLVTIDGAKYHILDKALPGTEFREGIKKKSR